MMESRPVLPREERPAGYPARRLLGQVLVEGGFITPETLERALSRQRETGEMLGEALVRMGALDSLDLTAVLSVQGELSSVEGALRAAAGGRRMLGELLLAARRITPEQLDRALAEQERTGERVGEILVRRGILSRPELDAVLAFQDHQERGGGTPSPFRLGEILVATGQITRRQLDISLSRQARSGSRLGELLVDSGYAAPQQVSRGLAIQKKLVAAALAAALSLAAASGAHAGEAPSARPSAGSSSARIRVSATVLPRTTVTVHAQPHALIVTPADVRRGYVEVPRASRIELASNDPRGYLLVFEPLGGPESPVREAIVDGLDRQIQVGPGGGFVPRPFVRGVVSAELSFRFVLAEDARPGRYPWPVMLSAQSL
ncbi:MAG: hypothetical protein Kow00128_14860 [Deltaproteobacteria bacterium]